MTSELGSDVILKFFGNFRKNLSNSITAPNFAMIRQETTKLEGGVGVGIMAPHTVVFLK